MSLQKYVHQMRDRKVLDNKSQFSEAYDIIPKSSGEIDSLDIPHDKESLKGLFDEIVSSSGMADPIALQASTPKNVKVSRSVSDDFNLPELSKKYGFKVTEGEGSRGGRGSKSTGFAFEGEVTKDIETYIAEGETSENFKYPDFMKDMHRDILSKHEQITVSLEGGANTRRPLEFTDIGALIGGRELNIGHKVTDVTVIGDDKSYFLSLKFGGTVTFFNAGVGRIFTADQFEKGKITNQDAKKLLDIFGIDEKRFIEIFTKYKKGAKKSAKQKVNATRNTNLRALLQLLVTGIGHGYYMVHRKGKKVEFYEMNRRRMMDSAKVKSVTILYPKPGSAKRLDIEVVTKLYIFKINIRNKQGGLYPSHIMCDYVPNPDFKP